MKNTVNHAPDVGVKKHFFTNLIANAACSRGTSPAYAADSVSQGEHSRQHTDSTPTAHRQQRQHPRFFRYVASILFLLCFSIGSVWGETFAAGEIVKDSGTGSNKGHVTCSSSVTSTTTHKVKNTNQDVVYLDQQVDTCIFTKKNYVQVQADADYTLDGSIVVQGAADDNSAGNIAILLWRGDYSNSTADSVIAVEAPSRASTTLDEFTVRFPSGRFRTIRLYRRISYNSTGGIIGKDCPGTQAYRVGDKKLSIQSITVTATASGSSGSTDSTVPSIAAPTSTPDLMEITQGATKQFSVTATGYPAPTYAWYSCDDGEKTNPAEITGATAASYTTPNTLAVGTYYYYCVATNASGIATSPVFSLKVNPLGADLTAHTPGIYEKAQASGGYGAALITYDEREYETFYFTYTSSKLYLSAGNLAYNATGHFNLIDAASISAGTEVKGGDWFGSAANSYGNGSSPNTQQFNVSASRQAASLRDANKIRLKVSG